MEENESAPAILVGISETFHDLSPHALAAPFEYLYSEMEPLDDGIRQFDAENVVKLEECDEEGTELSSDTIDIRMILNPEASPADESTRYEQNEYLKAALYDTDRHMTNDGVIELTESTRHCYWVDKEQDLKGLSGLGPDTLRDRGPGLLVFFDTPSETDQEESADE